MGNLEKDIIKSSQYLMNKNIRRPKRVDKLLK